MSSMNSNSAQQLNSLLQGEISAVETYEQALETIYDPSVKKDLMAAQDCHSRRVDVLRQEIMLLGAEPAETSGPWGIFAKAMEGGAKLLGEVASIDMLEEGEDQGLEEYRKLFEGNDPIVHTIVAKLLPRQEDTHNLMSNLKHRIH